MPFNCFKYQGFTSASKRYHTAAKHSTAFFDSSFNHIRQNTQLQTLEKVAAQGAKRYANPHPANAAATQYLQFDASAATVPQLDDDSTLVLKNPINVVIPVDQGKRPYKMSPQIQIVPVNNVIASKLQQKRAIHTDIKSVQQQEALHEPQQEPTPEPSIHSEAKYFTPDEIEYVELTDETFVNQHTLEITKAYKAGQYEKINALYMAMKRNGLVPSREVYDMVLSSIAKRDIDYSVDDQLSTMLNVYQDLIANKIKPDLHIYSTVIYQLLDKSIYAAMVPGVSENGVDFFKIAIDIFNASNCSHIQEFDSSIINLVLTGMNLYPGLVNNTQLIKILEDQPNFVKNEVYYTSLITYCKFTNDSELAISLYEEFKLECQVNPALKQNQFIIYSAFISTLVATNEISLATKFLDKLLTSIKSYDDYESKVTMLLSSYLLHLSKSNFNKTLEIWAQFARIDWIPEFSYEFYSQLLEESMRGAPYETSLKLYNYMSALPRSHSEESYDLSTLLITPRRSNNAVSLFILCALQQNDKSTVLKILRESFVKQFTFDHHVYQPLFQFIQSDDLVVKVINTHGLIIKGSFEFLNFLTRNIANLPIYDIAKTEFFKRLVSEFSLAEPKDILGFLQVWKSVFDVNKASPKVLELCAPVIVDFYDLNNYYADLPSKDLVDFKMALTGFFIDHYTPQEDSSSTMKEAIALLQDMNLMN
jgi:ribonuclease P protein component